MVYIYMCTYCTWCSALVLILWIIELPHPFTISYILVIQPRTIFRCYILMQCRSWPYFYLSYTLIRCLWSDQELTWNGELLSFKRFNFIFCLFFYLRLYFRFVWAMVGGMSQHYLVFSYVRVFVRQLWTWELWLSFCICFSIVDGFIY